jgi:hypothetical protein
MDQQPDGIGGQIRGGEVPGVERSVRDQDKDGDE